MEVNRANPDAASSGPGVRGSVYYLIVLIAVVPMITGLIGDFFGIRARAAASLAERRPGRKHMPAAGFDRNSFSFPLA